MCVPRGKFLGVFQAADGQAHALAVPIFCKKWACERCGPRKKKQLFARAMNGAIAEPVKGFRPQYSHKLLTLTCPGAEYRATHTPEETLADMNRKWNLTTRAMKKRLGDFDYLKIIEFQKDGYPHFHILLAGRVIAPKGILEQFRYTWTQHHGMGNVDIQKNRCSSVKKMVGYIMKYLTKSTVVLPKGKRLYTASRKALSPVKKPAPKEYLYKKLCWENFVSIEAPQEYVADDVFELGKFDPDIRMMFVEDWRDNLYHGRPRHDC